ncbi:MAG: glycoside hydrolase [Gemmatimonadota bacterium]
MKRTVILLAVAFCGCLEGQTPGALRWRSIGPFRGGRIRAMSGVASQPYTFYFAQGNGGLWRTTDAGRTWLPIFDGHTQSVGALAIPATNPDIIYVGSGEALPRPDLSVGDGVYKSTDAGKTWTHLGLRDAQQIPQIAVDPRDPNRLFVAALGHPYGPSMERGIYRSTDGGQTFIAVLQKDENAGGNDVDIDPSNPNIVYANLWEQRQGPWENAAWLGNGGGLFKSTDGGASWTQLTNGLPPTTNQVNLAISPANPRRLFASVASNGPPGVVGLYRSDDAGDSWTRITTDNRPAGRIGGGDLPVPIMHPTDPDIIIMASTVSWKSTDGGRTWAAYKGAPGGEDYQNGWINPNNTNIVFMVSDQGAVVSLNGGETWSSWYNQPNAMLYHVSADNAFPYRVCSGQQESGSACVSSRGNYGVISDRDWLPVGVDEYGYVAPDPLNADIVFGGRAVTRFDRRTGQTSAVGPLAGRQATPGAPNPYRQVRTQPVVFSQANPKMLLFGNNYLWKTYDGGANWAQIAGDLTRKTYELPASIGKHSDPALVQQRGVIYSIGPSPLDTSVIWFGTDDGLIYTTTNGGKTWADVTPPPMGPWWKVFMMDAGHFDKKTAYAAVNTLRLDDMRPHLYRTHDGGKTWTDISNLPGDAGPANALREDPKVKGLLYAATEKGVYISRDDGDTWWSMQFNLPRTSVRDLIVKDDDIVVATHGRGFWILDNITPLRQVNSTSLQADVLLFAPAPALRVRWNTSTDMPWPKEEPAGENPPEGAAIDYLLKSPASVVTLDILDARGRVVRTYASTDSLPYVVPTAATAPVPLYWYKQPQRLSASAGTHRFFWDVHYQPLPVVAGGGGFGGGGGGGGGAGLPINSVPGLGAPAPRAPWVAAGKYTVRLTVDGKTYSQPIEVKQDPRVKTPALAMREVYALTDSLYFTQKKLQDAADEARAANAKSADPRITAVLDAPDPKAPAPANPNAPRPAGPGTLRAALTSVAALTNGLQQADVGPTATQRAAIGAALRDAGSALARWNTLRRQL